MTRTVAQEELDAALQLSRDEIDDRYNRTRYWIGVLKRRMERVEALLREEGDVYHVLDDGDTSPSNDDIQAIEADLIGEREEIERVLARLRIRRRVLTGLRQAAGPNETAGQGSGPNEATGDDDPMYPLSEVLRALPLQQRSAWRRNVRAFRDMDELIAQGLSVEAAAGKVAGTYHLAGPTLADYYRRGSKATEQQSSGDL